jgi:hypothetical protein
MGDVRVYTRAELEHVAAAAVREAVEDAEPERVEQLSRRALREFDEGREAAAVANIGPVRAGEEFPTIGYPRSDRLPG